MEKFDFKLEEQENWILWRKWELTLKHGGVINQFVSNGILSEKEHFELFLEFWNEYENSAKEFLTHIFEVFHKQSNHDVISDGGSVDFNIDFRTRAYTMSHLDEQFLGYREFAIKNLSMEIVERLVRNALKDESKK
ncbi:hypothetical protein D3C71_1633310 [compost metagenome]